MSQPIHQLPSTAGGSSKKAPKAAAPPSPAATAAAPATASTPTKHNPGYSRDPSDTATVGDEQRVHKLLSDRLAAKRAREFDQADRIREELLSIGIQVFDRVKFWRVAPPEGAKAAASPAPKGGGSGGPGPAAKSASRPQSGGSATKALSGQIAPADAALAAAEAAGLTLQRAPGSATGFVGVKYAAGEVNPYKAFYESKGEGARIYHLGYYACAEAAALAHAFKTKEMEGAGAVGAAAHRSSSRVSLPEEIRETKAPKVSSAAQAAAAAPQPPQDEMDDTSADRGHLRCRFASSDDSEDDSDFDEKPPPSPPRQLLEGFIGR